MQNPSGRSQRASVRSHSISRRRSGWHPLLAAVLVLWAGTAWPQTDGTLDFRAALEMAEARSPELEAADQSVSAARERAVASGQLPDPVLTAGVSNMPIGGDERYSLTSNVMTMRRIGVMQKITDPEKRRLRQARGEQAVARDRAERGAIRAALRRAVAATWLDRAYAARTSRLIESLRAELRLQISTLQPLVASGRSSAAQLRAVEMMLVETEDRLESSRQQEQVAVRALSRWLGDDASRPPGELPDTSRLTHDMSDVTDAITHHPELSVAAQDVALARSDVKLAEREKTPDWTVEVTYQHRGPNYVDMLSFGVSVPLPLFAADRQDRDIRASQAALARAEARRLDTEARHRAELRSLLEDWRRLGDRITTLQGQLLPLAKERVDLLLAEYRGGSASLNVVLEARRADVDARLRVLALQRDRARTWARLNFLGIEPSAPQPPETVR
ncbi:MAG: heavy metal resistance protein CzcC [Betaproteobacteria bacterium]|nr:heavy metal resistance protein CzcC [Betaproteobacteria bacterium]